ncbi:MAG TPA: hypothetical protein VIV11_12295, partial [Kofleriaceae bacterium]
MRGIVLAWPFVVGCSFSYGFVPGDGAMATSDAADDDAPDGMLVTIDAPISTDLCFGSPPVRICFAQPLTTHLVITTQTLDTGGNSCMPHTSPDAIDVCVLAGASISLASGVTL